MPLTAASIRFLVLAALVGLTFVKGFAECRSLKHHRHPHPHLHPHAHPHPHPHPHLGSSHRELEETLPRELSLSHAKMDKGDARDRGLPARWRDEMYAYGGAADKDPKSLARLGTRRKRHGSPSYQKMTEQDKRDFLEFRRLNKEWMGLLNNERNRKFDDYYEMEVKEAQNSSICNYTVVAIPDTRGSRIPSDLEHVICNHVGSSCQNVGSYCCIQTYRKVEVRYADGFREIVKVYAGCVCALQIFDEVADTQKPLPIND